MRNIIYRTTLFVMGITILLMYHLSARTVFDAICYGAMTGIFLEGAFHPIIIKIRNKIRKRNVKHMNETIEKLNESTKEEGYKIPLIKYSEDREGR